MSYDIPAVITHESKDGKRPTFTFFDPAPLPIFTQICVNGDFDRRYIDIGSKHLKLIDQKFTMLKNKNNILLVSQK